VNILPLVISGTALAMAMMVVVWFFARRMNNAGIVDIWWSFGFTPVALFYGIFGSGHIVRNALIAAMVFAWSFRLGMHLYKRVCRITRRRTHAIPCCERNSRSTRG